MDIHDEDDDDDAVLMMDSDEVNINIVDGLDMDNVISLMLAYVGVGRGSALNRLLALLLGRNDQFSRELRWRLGSSSSRLHRLLMMAVQHHRLSFDGYRFHLTPSALTTLLSDGRLYERLLLIDRPHRMYLARLSYIPRMSMLGQKADIACTWDARCLVEQVCLESPSRAISVLGYSPTRILSPKWRAHSRDRSSRVVFVTNPHWIVVDHHHSDSSESSSDPVILITSPPASELLNNSAKRRKSVSRSSFSGSKQIKYRSRRLLHCVCQKPNDESKPMVACESCRDWFHFRCVDFFPNSKRVKFFCQKCLQSPRLFLNNA